MAINEVDYIKRIARKKEYISNVNDPRVKNLIKSKVFASDDSNFRDYIEGTLQRAYRGSFDIFEVRNDIGSEIEEYLYIIPVP